MKNFALLFIAVLLSLFGFPLGILTTFIQAIRRGSLVKIWGYLSKMALNIALSLDCMGNTICRDMLNLIMRKPGGYDFGVYNETISRGLGKNKASGTLTRLGRNLAYVLNFIDPGHVERAAQDH